MATESFLFLYFLTLVAKCHFGDPFLFVGPLPDLYVVKLLLCCLLQLPAQVFLPGGTFTSTETFLTTSGSCSPAVLRVPSERYDNFSRDVSFLL